MFIFVVVVVVVVSYLSESLLSGFIYSETSFSGPSQKWTTSVKRTTIKAPIEFTIELVYLKPLRNGLPPDSGHCSMSKPIRINIKLPPKSGH